MRRFMQMFYDADPGVPGGGGGEPAKEPPKGGDEDKKELERLRAENEALKKAEKERKAKAEEERKARLSQEEKKAEEEKALRDSLVSQNRDLQLKKAGLDAKYAPLVGGGTAEEIEASGKLLAELVEEAKAKAIAGIKQTIAGTGAPGTGGGDGGTMTLEEYTLKTLKGGN